MRQARLILCVAAAATGLACGAAPAVLADRIETTITIQLDGSARVDERVMLPAGASGPIRYARTLERVDAFAGAAALLDGAPLPAGQIDATDGLHVEWSPPRAASQLTLQYTARGAVAVRGGHATFFWRPVAEGFAARAIRVSLILPAGTQLTGDPWLDGIHWTTTRQGSTLTFEHGDLPGERAAAIVVPFSIDTRAMIEPRWQIDAERGADLIPAFISAGLFILIVAGGVLVMVRLQYPLAARTTAPDPTRVSVARGLRLAGIATLVFGLLAWPVVEWTLGHFGAWPHAMSVSIIVSGLLMLVFGARNEI